MSKARLTRSKPHGHRVHFCHAASAYGFNAAEAQNLSNLADGLVQSESLDLGHRSVFWHIFEKGPLPSDEKFSQDPRRGSSCSIRISILVESQTALVQQRPPRAARRLQNLNPIEVRSIQADDLRQGRSP